MPGNHLEDLVAEIYELRGYFVRRNVLVGPRLRGGYECELDIVAFHPGLRNLVHIEPSLDTESWENRERRFSKKFDAGRKYIPKLFEGSKLPRKIEQIALFVYGGGGRTTLAGGRVMFIKDFMFEIMEELYSNWRHLKNKAIPEGYPLLRTLQMAVEYWRVLDR
jgi:hypothetical protein